MTDASARARQVSDQLLAARRRQRQADHEVARLLVEMADDELFRALGYARLVEYTTQVLELTPRVTRDLLRLGRRLADLPRLDAAMAAGDLDWTKARELLRVATPANEEDWIRRAREVPSRELERLVAGSRLGEPPADEPAPEGPRRRLVLELEAADAELILRAIGKARAETDLRRDEVDDGALLAAIARRYLADAGPDADAPTEPAYQVHLTHCPGCRDTIAADAEVSDTVGSEACCDAEVVEHRPGPRQGHLTRTIAPAVRRVVLRRFGGRCAVPGCGCTLWLHIHHLRHRTDGGGHDVANLLPLCPGHHRAVHAGLLALSFDEAGRVVVVHGDGRTRVGTPHVGRVRAGSDPRGAPRGADPGLPPPS